MTAAITLMEAYLIETPISKGMKPERLLKHVRAGDVAEIQAVDEKLSYEDLHAAYEADPERLTAAMTTGYTIKFVSLTGIERLARLKFGLAAGNDYTIQEDRIIGMPLSENELAALKQILSPNWHVCSEKTVGGQYQVDILHQTVK